MTNGGFLGDLSEDAGASFFGSIGSAASSVLPFAAPIVTALQGLFGESAEDQYKRAQQEKLNRQIGAIKNAAQIQRGRSERMADRNANIARLNGSRQAAARGITGANLFSAPQVGNINDNLAETQRQINENETSGILNAEAGQDVMPSYEFPNRFDYLSSAFGGAAKYMTQKDIFDIQRRTMASQNAPFRN